MNYEFGNVKKPFLVGHSFGLEDPNFQRIVGTTHVLLAGLDRLPQTN